MKRKLLISVLIFIMICVTVSLSVFAADADAVGIELSDTDHYQSVDALSEIPLTFEAWIKISKDMPDSAKGPIAGNYNGGLGTHDVINFEIAELGVPKVYIRQYDAEAGAYLGAIQIYFPGTYNASTASIDDPVDLRTGELTHLAITLDPQNKKAYCYINGELCSTFSGEYYYYSDGVYKKSWKTYDISPLSSMDKTENISIGRDKRVGSSLSYLGGDYASIYSVAMYSELLTSEKISSHTESFDAEDRSLIAAYDLTAEGCERLKDHSKNRNHLYYTDTTTGVPSEFYKDPGFAPESSDYYQSINSLPSFPYTFESWLNISADAPDSMEGAIAGNYDASAGDSVVFAVAKLGVPRIYLKPYNEETGAYGSSVDAFFPEVDLRNGKPTHLAITVDPTANKAYCYINGELKSTYSGQKYYYNSQTNSYGKYSSTASIGFVSEMAELGNMAVGRDNRGGSYLFALDGAYAEIYSVAMYSRLLEAEEIARDVLRLDKENSALLAAYDMTLTGKDRLRDLSANGNHLFYSNSSSIGLTEWYGMPDVGFEFSSEKLYRNSNAPMELPRTLEASVYFPLSGKVNYAGGVILSTLGFDKGALGLEIGKGGTVVFTTVDKDGVTDQFVFDEVCVYSGGKTHIAVTVDDIAEEICCFINGELKQTLKFSGVSYRSQHIAYAVGGDYRTGNKYCFGGRLVSCAAYSEVRSAEEIAEDVTSLDKAALIFAYDYNSSVESGSYPDAIKDMSDNGNDAIVPEYLIGGSIESDFDAAYSFAVVGDTQSLVNYYPDKLSAIYDWILENRESENIKFVMGLGDITENNTDAEWLLAKEQILKLQGAVPYSLAVGNHDTAEKLTATFEGTGYREQLDGSFGAGLENTYQELTVGECRYLIFSLDCGASDDVLAWAGEVIAAHPNHNVIITTHAYLFRDGTTLDETDRGSLTDWGYANNGDGIWDKLISKYENIVLVLSGHITSDEIVTSKRVGVNGNIVTEMLINPQDVDAKQFASGLVAMLYFSEDGRNVRVEYYSTVQEQYYMHKNQFETTVDTVDSESPAASFVPRMNITLDSNLIFNIYVPVTDILEAFELDGVEYTELEKLPTRIIDDKNYYAVRIPLAAKDAARDIKLIASVKNGDSKLSGTFTFNVVKYANRIFAGDSEAEKALMKDVLAYIECAYEYFKSETVPQICDILGDYKRELIPEGSSEKPSVSGITSATLELGSEPAIVFYLEEGYTASEYVFTQNGKILSAEEGDDGSIRIKLLAYRMCDTVDIAYKNENSSFHINSYYEFAKAQNDDRLIAIVEAFWNYCLSARDYRNEVIGKEITK